MTTTTTICTIIDSAVAPIEVVSAINDIRECYPERASYNAATRELTVVCNSEDASWVENRLAMLV